MARLLPCQSLRDRPLCALRRSPRGPLRGRETARKHLNRHLGAPDDIGTFWFPHGSPRSAFKVHNG